MAKEPPRGKSANDEFPAGHNPAMPPIPAVALGVYLIAVLGIGIAWRKRAGRDELSFYVANRSLNTFWGFTGMASLTTGGSTTIALAALVYTHGIVGLWLDLAGALGLLALGLLLARDGCGARKR